MQAHGRVTLKQIVNRRVVNKVIIDNELLYDWGYIVINLLRGNKDKQYTLSHMYIEFENNLGAAVTPPTVSRDQGKSYYDSLAGSNRDYLRVPILSHSTTNTDTSTYPNDNKLILIGVTSGSTGVHGLTFDDTNQSRIYGVGIVSALDPSNSSSDIVFARTYFTDQNKQLIKQANSQISLTWEIWFD